MDLAVRTTISGIIAARDAALVKIREAIDLKVQSGIIAREAGAHEVGATAGRCYYSGSDREKSSYSAIFNENFDPEESFNAYRRRLDASTWLNIVALTGIEGLMDRTAKDEFDRDLAGDVTPITEENVFATVEALAKDHELIFQRGVARVFSELDRRFKSHDGFKVGSRIILSHVFDGFGHFSFGGRSRENLADIDRVFARFDKERTGPIDLSESARAVEKDRGHGYEPRQSVTETRYYRVRVFKNGNAHLWFTRDDLVDDVNRTLAKYYGEVLPEAPPEANATRPEDLRSPTGALSKDLAFYPSPPPVVAKLLGEAYLADAVVLEPSAGVGDIVRGLLAWQPDEYMQTRYGAKGVREIHAIEYDAGRAAQIPHDPRVRVRVANFLLTTPDPRFTHVIMNPPFCDTHWMAHVMHAFDFLAPGGTLLAVLPASAQINETSAHETFRAWAEARRPGRERLFIDLPPESFKASGTRINTVILRLEKKS